MLGKPPLTPDAPAAGLPQAPPATATATAQPPAGFDEAYNQLRASPDVQFNMQPYQPPEMPRVDPSSVPNLNFGPVIQIILYVLIAIVVLAILYLIITRVTGWSWRKKDKSELEPELEPEWQIGEPAARRLLQEADTLAAAGRFDEAVRVLLFRSIEEIDAKRPETLRPADTSRDIARLPTLPHGPAEAFGRIVRAVERSLFARQTLGHADWDDCRAAYERFAFEREWQAR